MEIYRPAGLDRGALEELCHVSDRHFQTTFLLFCSWRIKPAGAGRCSPLRVDLQQTRIQQSAYGGQGTGILGLNLDRALQPMASPPFSQFVAPGSIKQEKRRKSKEKKQCFTRGSPRPSSNEDHLGLQEMFDLRFTGINRIRRFPIQVRYAKYIDRERERERTMDCATRTWLNSPHDWLNRSGSGPKRSLEYLSHSR